MRAPDAWDVPARICATCGGDADACTHPQIECETPGCHNEVLASGEVCKACCDSDQVLAKCWACGGNIRRDRFSGEATCSECHRIWRL